jgi:hypothetical protein
MVVMANSLSDIDHVPNTENFQNCQKFEHVTASLRGPRLLKPKFWPVTGHTTC